MRITRWITAVAMMAALAGMSGRALSAQEAMPLTVYVTNHAAPLPVITQAKAEASKMFANIGIAIQWRSGHLRTADTDGSIVIQITDETPVDCPKRLAYALPYEGVHIRVFYSRIEATVEEPVVPALLAHVMVHEMTHLLEGIDRHSPTGVMKAQWRDNDFRTMAIRPLAFEAIDVQLIRSGFEAREKRAIGSTLLARR